MRSRLLVLMAVTLAAALLIAVGPNSIKAAAVAPNTACKNPGTSVPILFVHGLNGSPSDFTAHANGSETLPQRLAAIPNTFVDDTFSYSTVADKWVTNPGIGQALADRITCLAAKSKAAGGNGKVVVVAHSMGGLAVREAASLTGSAAGKSASSSIGLLVTVATPNTGSWSDALFHNVRDGLTTNEISEDTWLLQGICGAVGVSSGPKRPGICGIVQGATSQAGSAMVPGSSQLAALPRPPVNVPIDAVAGQMTVTANVFGHTFTLFPAGSLGDLLVKRDSALAYASANGNQGYTDSCTMSVPEVLAGLGWNGCTHGGLLYDPAVGEQIASWVSQWVAGVASPTSVAVVTCPTQILGGAAITQPTAVTVKTPLEGLPPMTMYTDAEGGVDVLAPSGWNCQAVVGNDGNTPVEVWPTTSPAPTNIMPLTGASGYFIPGCEGCMYDLLCPLFSTASLSSMHMNFQVQGPCPSMVPTGETNQTVQENVVDFSDPPGVSGTWDNSSGRYDVRGLVYFDPSVNGSQPVAGMAGCALPTSQQAICTAFLNDFKARYVVSPSTPTSPSVTTTSTTTTAVSPAPVVTASCAVHALASAATAYDQTQGSNTGGVILAQACSGNYAGVVFRSSAGGGYGADIAFQMTSSGWTVLGEGNFLPPNVGIPQSDYDSIQSQLANSPQNEDVPF